MTVDEVVALMLAGGLGALGKTAVDAFKERAASRREDRRQKVEEAKAKAEASKTKADSSLTLIESAERIVKLQNEQIDDLKAIITDQQAAFQKRLDAQAAALAAYETRLDNEMEARRKADVIADDLRSQLTRLRDELSEVKAAFKMADQNMQALRIENEELKGKLFKMSLGIAALIRQLKEARIEPAYTLEVPVVAAAEDQAG